MTLDHLPDFRSPDTLVVIQRRVGCETYMVVFHASEACEATQAVARFAKNPQLSFTWWDAARMTQGISQICRDYKETRS